MDTATDVVIIGGGIGGSGLAALLAKGGLSVTVLERTHNFPDRVRGEMYCPWGVAIAKEIGLLDVFLAAGATFTTRWAFYDEAFPPEVAEELAVDCSAILPGIDGIMNFTHPAACQALFDHAKAAGATMIRGVEHIDLDIAAGGSRVTWRDEDGRTGDVVAGLVVGADGRNSAVRRQCGIELHSAPVRQYMSGLLVEGPDDLSSHIDSYGTGPTVNWYSFPQGPRTSRIYLAHNDVHRYTGDDAVVRFLADLREAASPDVASLAGGRAVTPIATHTSVDTWTDEPFAPGAVLVGDAAGYNDPIIGQGLSLTMADLRDVSRIILAGGRTPADFAAYGAARNDRHAKQRIASQAMAELMCAFGEDSAGRRLRALPLMGTDETVGMLAATLFAGPEIFPPGVAPVQAAREAILAV